MSLSRHRDGRARTSKHTRLVRRANADLRRQVRRMATSGRGAYVTLLAVLAQSGGEVSVTKGTIDQVNENFKNLSFVVEARKELPNEYVVKMVVGEATGEGEGDKPPAMEPEQAGESPAIRTNQDTLGIEDAVAEDTHGESVV